MHNNSPACSPVIITITLYGTRMAHIFVRVGTLAYNGALPSIFTRHRGHQYLPRTAKIFSHLRLDAATTKKRHAVRPGSLGLHGVRTEQAH